MYGGTDAEDKYHSVPLKGVGPWDVVVVMTALVQVNTQTGVLWHLQKFINLYPCHDLDSKSSVLFSFW
jgi:hypothetical protein